MAVNAYLNVDGVTGPSTSKTGFIDILSFSWGVSQTATYGTGHRAKRPKPGRADFSNLTIMKVLDTTSPLLCDHCASGDILEKCLHPVRQAGGRQAGRLFPHLSEGRADHIGAVSGSNENPTESVSFAFQDVEIAYKAGEGRRHAGSAQSEGLRYWRSC